MRQLSASVLALALGLAAAMALISCGAGNDADLLPGETASEINASLDMVRDLANSGDCEGAQDAAQQVSDQIDGLSGIDGKLKQTLLDAAERLNEVVADCVDTTTEAISPATIPEPAESTTGPPEEKEKEREKEPKKTKTEMPPETPTETTPTTPTTPAPVPVPPTDGGGTGAPGGVSPGDAVDEDE
jgi:outer membrane biosynthesis protein TonB